MDFDNLAKYKKFKLIFIITQYQKQNNTHCIYYAIILNKFS